MVVATFFNTNCSFCDVAWLRNETGTANCEGLEEYKKMFKHLINNDTLKVLEKLEPLDDSSTTTATMSMVLGILSIVVWMV
jgi:hypothetical protein